jgi:8-oxo-dGTP diphosphatase|tara:strand:+ start:158 stop:844 length:687 start_codon:yes stop_codon:yes gene_type:complete
MINPNISVDCVVFGFDGQNLNVLLIEQKDVGQMRRLALPGDHLEEDEDLDTAAQRVLKELTSLSGLFLRQSGAFGDPDRVKNIKDLPWLQSNRSNPGARVITIAYYALVKMEDFNPSASSFAQRVFWQGVYNIPELAFDHSKIVTMALSKLRQEISELRVGHELLPEKFTLTQVQSLHESILNSSFDKRNFRKKVLNDSWVIPLAEKQTGVFHKPARLYSWNKDRLSI